MLDLGWRVAYLIYTFGLVYLHMEYVHGRGVAYTRRFILFQLVTDLLGFVATWAVLARLRPGEGWVFVALGVHFVVHALSLGWALLGWPSLATHLRQFQGRALHPAFAAAEFLYEQSDTAMYIVTMAIVAADLPFWLACVVAVALSVAVAILRPTAGFHRAPRGAQAAPAAER